MSIKGRNTRVDKPETSACLNWSSGSKGSAFAEINGCKIELIFSGNDAEESLEKALQDLQNDYIGKSIMR